ncbi:MAG: HAD family phosphatase [bacterium]
MVKAIFWDNDGILVDTEHLYYRATKEIFAGAGIDLTFDLFYELFLVQARGAWHLVAEKGYSETEIEAMRQARGTLYARYLREEPIIINGVETVLSALHGTYTMAVVTSSHRDHFEIIHQTTGLKRYFDFVLTSDDYGKVKPDPEGYILAIERVGLSKDECIAVEDSERGLIAAQRAGLRCLIIPTELTKRSLFPGAAKILKSINDITPNLLNSLE